MNNKLKLVTFILLIGILLTACQGMPQENQNQDQVETGSQSNRQMTVYTSIYPLYEVAERISGDNLAVELVIPNGAELHSYRPTPQQIAKLGEADLFFYNGVGLEPWASDVKENLTEAKAKMVNISQDVNLIDYRKTDTINNKQTGHNHSSHEEETSHNNHDTEGEDNSHKHDNDAHNENKTHQSEESHTHEAEHNHSRHEEGQQHDHEANTGEHNHEGEYDPHLWLDPLNMKLIAQKMKEEFVRLDPENEAAYQNNYEEFAERINELDKEYRSTLANKEQKNILVSHSAFGYLANRYDFKQLSVTGVAPHEEPSPGVLADLTTYAQKEDLDYIFMETLASPKTVNILAQEADLEVLELNPIAGLTKEEEKNGEDYFSLMYQNLTNLKKALVK